MLICFEGPDCTGKSTQAEILEKYINENYPGLTTWKYHFPMNQTLRAMLSGSLKVNNPYHFQMMFLTDFYNAIYEKKLPIIDKIQSYKDVVIFDRYYYSTLVMARHTIDPKYLEGFEEKDIEDYKTDLDIFVRDALAKIDIPHPDLTFVLMSRWEQIERRLNEKKKDSYESNMKMMKDVYSAYVESLNNQDDIYHSNRENLAPVVISSTKNITPKVVFGTDLEYGYLNKLASMNYKTKEEISKEITQVFDIFLSEFMNKHFFEIIVKEKKCDDFAGKEFDITEQLSKYFKGEFVDDKDIPVIKSYTKNTEEELEDPWKPVKISPSMDVKCENKCKVKSCKDQVLGPIFKPDLTEAISKASEEPNEEKKEVKDIKVYSFSGSEVELAGEDDDKDAKIVDMKFNKDWFAVIYLDNMDEFDIDIYNFIKERFGFFSDIVRIYNDYKHLYVSFNDIRGEHIVATMSLGAMYYQSNNGNHYVKRYKYTKAQREPSYPDVIKQINNVAIEQGIFDKNSIVVQNELGDYYRFSIDELQKNAGQVVQYSFDKSEIHLIAKRADETTTELNIGLYTLNSVYYGGDPLIPHHISLEQVRNKDKYEYNHTYIYKDERWIDATILQNGGMG